MPIRMRSGIRSASAKTYEQLCEDALGGFCFYAVTVMTACMTFGNVSAYLMVRPCCTGCHTARVAILHRRSATPGLSLLPTGAAVTI